MNKLDEALVNLRQNMEDERKQSAFYDLFLNATFFLPIVDDREPKDEAVAADGSREVVPLVTEAEGNDYLMIFDTPDRLKGWAKDGSEDQDEVRFVEVPGHLIVLSAQAPLHLALNAGTEFSKQFHPAEIAWLKEGVERCNAEAQAGEQESSTKQS